LSIENRHIENTFTPHLQLIKFLRNVVDNKETHNNGYHDTCIVGSIFKELGINPNFWNLTSYVLDQGFDYISDFIANKYYLNLEFVNMWYKSNTTYKIHEFCIELLRKNLHNTIISFYIESASRYQTNYLNNAFRLTVTVNKKDIDNVSNTTSLNLIGAKHLDNKKSRLVFIG
jgi:hypothetical protein